MSNTLSRSRTNFTYLF